jgi:hypothetical protein
MNDQESEPLPPWKRAILLRHAAKGANIKDRRLWLTADEEVEFDALIAPLGSHILGLSQALDHHGVHPFPGRVAKKRAKPAKKPNPAPAPKNVDASKKRKPTPPKTNNPHPELELNDDRRT